METIGKHYVQKCINIAYDKGFKFEASQALRQLERLVLKNEDQEETKVYTEEEVKDLIDYIINNASILDNDLFINNQLLDSNQVLNRWIENKR